VLLIDDPPTPGNEQNAELLRRARELPADVMAALEEPRRRVADALDRLRDDLSDAGRATPAHAAAVSEAYHFAADWLEARAAAHPLADHTDAFYADRVLIGLAGDLRLTTIALDGAINGHATTTVALMTSESTRASVCRGPGAGLSSGDVSGVPGGMPSSLAALHRGRPSGPGRRRWGGSRAGG